MKRFFLILALLSLILTGCSSQLKPDEVVLKAAEPVKTKNIEQAMTYYADDITYTMIGFSPEPQVVHGEEAFRAWLEEQYTQNMDVEVKITEVNGNQVKASTKFTSDFFHGLGIDWMECDEEYTIKDGKIQSWSCTVTQDSLQNFLAALPPTISLEELCGKWVLQDSQPTFFDYNKDGSYNMTRTVGAGVMDWDSGTFQLEGNLLTLVSGSGSKYCEPDSLGTYQVSMTDGGQLQVALQEDECWRRRPPVEGPVLLDPIQ